MTINGKIENLSEPLLEFGYSQKAYDPRDGLSMFGPVDGDEQSHPKNISYGVVGAESGILEFVKFISRMERAITLDSDRAQNTRLWPTYPGFESAFLCSLPLLPTSQCKLDEKLLTEAAMNEDPNLRASMVVSEYLAGIRQVTIKDDPLDVIICVVPELIYKNCRPKSIVRDGIGTHISENVRKMRAKGQRDLFNSYSTETYEYSVDFRRQLKAKSMDLEYNRQKVPIQILRDTTLRLSDDNEFGKRSLTPLLDRAWNISTAIFYKAGGRPWRLSTTRAGVCYVGLVYRRADPALGERTACCAAQMFLDTGDGIVLRSDFGPWYSPKDKQMHLTEEASKDLLSRVLNTYKELEGKPLKEVFLHYRSYIDESEFAGFKSACTKKEKLVAIRLREEKYDLRLYREGKYPIIRGTFLQLSDRVGYLWASGFKARLGTYDGWETPVPLRIDIQYGVSDIKQVANDIMGLTKLNFNECRFGDSSPVTIEFSNAVGEILVSNPKITKPDPRFKFYI